MGNYQNIEAEFISRTIRLIDQYYNDLNKFPFEEQYNYTLTLNCLLGLIVMPKERVVAYIPPLRITENLKNEIGLELSELSPDIQTLRDLIHRLRHSIAHFDINIVSEDNQNRIDFIEFIDSQNNEVVVAKFKSQELLPFLKYYSSCLLENLERYREN